MQATSLLRSIIVAGAVAGTPAALAAQSCLGYALAPSQHSVSFDIADRGFDPGPGGEIAGVLKNNGSYAFQTSMFYIDNGGPDFDKMYFWQLQVAQPVLRNKYSAGTTEAPRGPCALLELGGSSYLESTSTNAGIGLGYSLNGPRYAAFAAPMFGMVQAGDFNDTYVKLLVGGGLRLGALHLGADVGFPVQPSGGDPVTTFRLGFAWGKATQVPATPVRTSTTQSSSVGGTAATTASAVSTAGTKPYTLEDVEAMVKNSVPTARIVQLSKQSCLGFRMDDASETRLRRIGADAELLAGLRQSCYSAS